ncbi:hypothetical protein D9M71_463370 [compost metagenome]
MPQGNLERYRAEGAGGLQLLQQLRVRHALRGPQLKGRGIQALQAQRGNGRRQCCRVRRMGEQLFAQLHTANAGGCQQVKELLLATLPHKIGAVAGEADGNGVRVHCFCPYETGFIFDRDKQAWACCWLLWLG